MREYSEDFEIQDGVLIKYKGKGGHVVIPDSVTSIANLAFSVCKSLTRITIPEGMTSIGRYAFTNCESLTNIAIPNSVTSIGEGAFDGCTCLSKIQVAENNGYYKEIDGSLYSKDGKTLVRCACDLERVSFQIPDGVTCIGFRAFDGCKT